MIKPVLTLVALLGAACTTIAVNPNPSVHYQYCLPQRTAEKKLVETSRTATLEESFVYDPKMGCLIETGTSETSHSVIPGYIITGDARSLTKYHLHLAKAVRPRLGHDLMDVLLDLQEGHLERDPANEKLEEATNRTRRVVQERDFETAEHTYDPEVINALLQQMIFLPSINDIREAWQAREFQNSYVHKIAMPYGLVTFSVEADVAQAYTNLVPELFQLEAKLSGMAIRDRIETVFQYVHEKIPALKFEFDSIES